MEAAADSGSMSSAEAEDTNRESTLYRGVSAMAPNAKGQSAEGELSRRETSLGQPGRTHPGEGPNGAVSE